METLETVGSYPQPYEAHIAQKRLRDSGIPAFLRNEHTISIIPVTGLSNAIGGVKVMVPVDRAQEARRLLETDAAEQFDEALEDPHFCPACGSPDTEPTVLRKFHTALPLALSATLLYLFGPAFIILVFPFFMGGPGVQCHTCQKKSYIGKWPLRRIGKVMGLGAAVLAALLFLQTLFTAWNKNFTAGERDWNQDGETSLGEYLESAFAVKVPAKRDDCFDYFNRVTKKKLKTDCGFATAPRLD